MRRSSHLLLTAALVLIGTRALAQQPMSPYGDEPAPPTMVAPIPPAPPAPPVAPVPPPIVVPPPGGYYQAPYAQPQPPIYYQPCPLPPPRSFHEEMQPNYGLIIGGLVMFGVSWSINAATAYVADEWKLAVPVVGPFMETQNVNSGDSGADRLLVGLLVFDGLVETAGAVMLVAGAITRHKVRVYDSPRLQVSVVPTGGPAGGGLAAFGRF